VPNGSRANPLKGWKEIAEFLGQPISVAQRWATTGMPVTRQGRFVVATPGRIEQVVGKRIWRAGSCSDKRYGSIGGIETWAFACQERTPAAESSKSEIRTAANEARRLSAALSLFGNS
jgi:hypothetical protein